jgi:hypothetical protein
MPSNILHNLLKYHPTIKGHHGRNRQCRHDATKGRHDSLRHADFSGCCDASTARQLMQVSPTSGNRAASTLARPRLAGRADADKTHAHNRAGATQDLSMKAGHATLKELAHLHKLGASGIRGGWNLFRWR